MKIALVGYGKMGKAIEQIALERGHEIVVRVGIENQADFNREVLRQADVAIEFTGPESAFNHVQQMISWGIPVVCGSTGWLHQLPQVEHTVKQHHGAFLYASNFSVGVNIFFAVNAMLARLMARQTAYDVQITEVHHTAKLDAPSGTAITLAEQVLQHVQGKQQWTNAPSDNPTDLYIESVRQDPAPGTHTVCYASAIDDIAITHTAHSRQGFAMGAVVAAEYLPGRQGIYTMQDVLQLGQ